jgi:hypothetical protein
MKRIRTHLSYANAAATLAVLFAMSGGAIAATGGFSSGGTLRACVNEEGGLKLLKAGGHCRRGLKSVAWNVTGPAGRAGANGAAGAAGAAGAQGKEGATGKEGKAGPEGQPGTARAYADVSSTGALVASRSKNVVSTSRASEGIYCVTLPSSINVNSTIAVATIDVTGGGSWTPPATASIESTAVSCPGNQIEVVTRHETGATTDANTDEPFSVIVP